LPPGAKRKGGTGKAVPTYVEHQRYRKLLGQKGMAEAWQRLMQRTCRQAGDDTDLAGSELTLEILYALQKEAQENARRARSKLGRFLTRWATARIRGGFPRIHFVGDSVNKSFLTYCYR
jgi:hypothetical protein